MLIHAGPIGDTPSAAAAQGPAADLSMTDLLTQSVPVTSHADLVTRINAVPANGSAVFALPAGGITGGNAITINGGRRITLISQNPNAAAVYTQMTSLQRHFVVTAANSSLTLLNVTLDGGNAGGGINVDASGTVIVGPGAEITRSRGYIYSGAAYGGAIFVATSGVAILDGGVLYNNLARGNDGSTGGGALGSTNVLGMARGGAVHVQTNGVFTMYSGRIANNTAQAGTGTATGAGGWAYGGGISMLDGRITILGGIIENNLVHGGNGGANGAAGTAAAGEGTQGRGGGIEVTAGTLTIQDAVIRNNTAQSGHGGVRSGSATGATGASGTSAGGAIVVRSGTVTISRTEISGNRAIGGNGGARTSTGAGVIGNGGNVVGGAIFTDNGIFELSYVEFINNIVQGGTGGHAQSTASSIPGTGGSASGGAIEMYMAAVITMTGPVHFEGNQAIGGVGGDRLAGTTTNAAGSGGYARGGAICIRGGAVHGNGLVTMINNTVQGGTGGRSSSLTGSRGGAGGYAQGGALGLYSATATVELGNLVARNNRLVGGGGGTSASGAGYTGATSTDLLGGAIFITTGGKVSIGAGELSGHAALNGGAVYVIGASQFAMSGSILDNWAENNGGAIYLSGTNTRVTVPAGTIRDNRAGNNGGGVYAAAAAQMTATSATFQGNIAGVHGGGAYITDANSRLTVEYGVFQGNRAVNGGGVYAANIDNAFRINGGTMRDNVATDAGGAIYTARRSIGSHVVAPAYNNITTGTTVQFFNNSAGSFSDPPGNAHTLTNLGFSSASIFTHILNNYDINIQTKLCVRNHAELVEALGLIPVGGGAVIELHNDFPATGNTITISGGRQITITSCRDIVGQRVTYTQDRPFQRHFIVTGAGTSLTLANVVLDGGNAGGGINVTAGGTLVVSERAEIIRSVGHMYSGGAYGGAVFVDGATARLDGGVLYSNTIRGNNGGNGGGAGHPASSVLGMARGGAVHVQNNGVFTMYSGRIANNAALAGVGSTGTATASGGAGGWAYGGGISLLGGTVNILGGIIEDNLVQGGAGGANTAGGTTASGGAGQGRGGGIQVQTGTLVVRDAIIRNNTAQGGAGGVRGGTTTGASGIGHAGAGGGILVYIGNVTMTRTEISGNRAIGGVGGARTSLGNGAIGRGGNGHGGGFFTDFGVVEFSYVDIINNTAQGGPGGQTQSSAISIPGPGGFGRGGALETYSTAVITMAGPVHMEGNQAIGGAGGDRIAGVTSNPAGAGGYAQGGGVSLYNGTVRGDGLVTIMYNTAQGGAGGHSNSLLGSRGGDGGGAQGGAFSLVSSGSNVELENFVARNNGLLPGAGGTSASGALYTGAAATNLLGGAIYIEAAGRASIGAGEISENSAIQGGAAFITGTNSRLAMGTVEILDNTAEKHGGGIHVAAAAQATVINGTIAGNEAGGSGGGAFITGTNSRLTVPQGVFEGNRAQNGGGVYVTDISNAFILQSGAMRNNTATDSGGAIFTERRGIGMYVFSPAYNNITTGATVEFSGNSAAELSEPPVNAYILTNLGFASTSAYAHILNNYDVNAQERVCVRNHAELVAAINAIPAGGGAVIEIHNSFQATGNTITIGGGRQVTLRSCRHFPDERFTYTQQNASQRHFIVSGAGSSLTLENVVLDGAWVSGLVNRGGVLVHQGGSFVMNENSVIMRTMWRNQEGAAVHLGAGSAQFVMNGGELRENESFRGGGGVSVTAGASFTMHRGQIRFNRGTNAGVGQHSAGGVFVSGTGAIFTMYDGEIAENQAILEAASHGLSAGGIHVANGGHLEMHGGIVRLNTSFTGDAGNAGGIHVVNATATMRDGLIERNTGHSTTIGEGSGGIHISAGGRFEMWDGVVRNNSGTSVNGNTAGGVGVTNRASDNAVNNVGSGNSQFIMHDGLIEGNTAQRQGGGVSVLQRSGYPSAAGRPEFIMHGGRIAENYASVTGGGVAVMNHVAGRDARAIMHYGMIENNTAATTGGGVSINTTANNSGAHFRMVNGAIRGNEAGTHGGGVHVTATTGGVLREALFVMENGALEGNRAATHGGGAYVTDISDALVIYAGAVRDNIAGFDGGGIFTERHENEVLTITSAAAWRNIQTGAEVVFDGNRASRSFVPPENAHALTNIGFASTSIYDHVINNYDITFREIVIPYIPFSFTKVDGGLYQTPRQITPLAGATFALYFFNEIRFQEFDTDPMVDHTQRVTQAGIDAGIWERVQGPLTTGADGQLAVHLALATRTPIHQLVELSAPAGYLLPYGQWRITVANPDTGTVSVTTRGDAPNFVQIGGNYYLGNMPIQTSVPFRFIKTDMRLYDADISVAPLSGAIFELYRWNAAIGCTTHADLVTAAGISHGCWTLVGIQSGGGTSLEVQFGTVYQLVERAAPWGFVAPNGQWRVVPNQSTGRVDVTTMGEAPDFVTVNNEHHVGNVPIARSNFSFIKTDAFGVPLPGAQFSLCRFIPQSGSEPFEDMVTLEGLLYGFWEVVATVESGADGLVEFELTAGRYNMLEIVAPRGLERPLGQWRIDVVSDTDMRISVVGDAPAITRVGDTYRLVNMPRQDRFTFTKTDGSTPATLPLPGAEFRLYRYIGPTPEDMRTAELLALPDPDDEAFFVVDERWEAAFRPCDTVTPESIAAGYWAFWGISTSSWSGLVSFELDPDPAIYQLVEAVTPAGYEAPAGQWRILFDPAEEEVTTFAVGPGAAEFVLDAGGERALRNTQVGLPIVRFVLNYCDEDGCEHGLNCPATEHLFLALMVPEGTPVERPVEDPTRVGFLFLGWHTSSVAESPYNFNLPITEDLSLYAHWEEREVDVIFNQNDRGVQSDRVIISIPYGSLYEMGMTATPVLPLMVRPGFSFVGWYTAATGGVRVLPEDMLLRPEMHTLYARWSASVQITFHRNDGADIPRTVMLDMAGEDYTAAMSSPSVVALTQHNEDLVFLGWFDAPEGGRRIHPGTTLISTAAHTLYARWRGADVPVIFNGNGGTPALQTEIVSDDETTIGTLIARVTQPTRAEYIFLYWSFEPDGGAAAPSAIINRDEDTVLYAQWKSALVPAIELTATEGSDGMIDGVTVDGPGDPDFSADASRIVTIVVTPEEGYVFDGDTDVTVNLPPGWEMIDGPSVDGDGNIVVVIRKEIFAVTYLPGAGTGETYVVLGVPLGTLHEILEFDETGFIAPDGYAFIGWRLGEEVLQPGDEIEMTEDVTLVAEFGLIFTVTFHLYDGTGDYVIVRVIDGNPIAPEEIPDLKAWYSEAEAPPGYALRGWFTDEVLDESGRMLNGRRRPMPLSGLEADTNFDLEAVITAECFPPGESNLDLYAIWGLWGDVNGNDVVNLADLLLLQEYLAMFPVTIIREAGNVVANFNTVGEPILNLADYLLLQEYLAMFPVVLGKPS